MSTLQQVLRFLIETFGDLFLVVVILRFWLQQARADFYNPVSQAIVKVTNPILIPLRKAIPGFFGVDLAAIVLAVLVNFVTLMLVITVMQGGLNPAALVPIFLVSIIDLLELVCNIALIAIVILAVSSFIAPFSTHPILVLVRQMLDPLLRPIQKIIPPAGGLDFSVMFLAIAIYVVKIVLQGILAG